MEETHMAVHKLLFVVRWLWVGFHDSLHPWLQFVFV